jgi:DNA-binding MarR family transcriptional regulator
VDLERIFDDLVRLETRWWNDLDTRLRRGGDVPLGTLNVLQVLDAVRPCRVQDVAQALEISVGGASQAVDRVEAKGFCVRTPNPADRRSSVLDLTDAGRDALARARPRVGEGLREFLAALPDDRVEEFGRTLAELRSALTKE